VLALNGGGERWASLCSIIETCKTHDVAPACAGVIGWLDKPLPRIWMPLEIIKS
jgi:hypothetical protein